MSEIKNDYIKKALDELIPTLGVKEFIDHKKLVSLIYSKKIKECVEAIALYLGLPIEVTIVYVPIGYQPSANNGFQSAHLVKTDNRNRGIGGITAQVSIPSNLPFYGTTRMVNFPINVKLSENCTDDPETLISVMAHELSHIVLYSIWHKEKENEFYTDLTAMLLGFADVMKIGRKVIKTSSITNRGFFSSTTTTNTKTSTYGYLSDENFNFALDEIKNFLDKQKSARRKLLKKLKQTKRQVSKAKKLSFCFEKYLEYLDKNLSQKISQEDGQKIGAFHQAGYVDNFQSIVRESETNLENYLNFMENIKTYTGSNIETMQRYESQLELSKEELKKQCLILQKDVDVLKKYVSLFYKLRLLF